MTHTTDTVFILTHMPRSIMAATIWLLLKSAKADKDVESINFRRRNNANTAATSNNKRVHIIHTYSHVIQMTLL